MFGFNVQGAVDRVQDCNPEIAIVNVSLLGAKLQTIGTFHVP